MPCTAPQFILLPPPFWHSQAPKAVGCLWVIIHKNHHGTKCVLMFREFMELVTKTDKTLFLMFTSYTPTFSICPSEHASPLAFSASHIENSLTA